jgi:glycosyltransferase involved in cell wall biosynthesis
MTPPPPLVILTPVRNDGWILGRFLAVASQVADRVILADQGSTDDTREIAARFPAVSIIPNEDRGFDEAHRQRLLIDEARRLVPGPKVLLAIDADEIIAADATGRPGWRTMREAAPGTILSFERIDLYLRPDRCVRYDRWSPFGYVDDGAPHRGRTIHGNRVPLPEGAPLLKLPDVKLLHYSALRTTGLAAKFRWYSVLENALGTCPAAFKRRLRYRNHVDLTGDGRTEPTRPEWFAGWEALGIDMTTVADPQFHWYDVEVLRAFGRYGTGKFWLDDVWRFDWERCRQWAAAQGFSGIPPEPIRAAPDALVWVLRVADYLHRHQVWLRQRLSGRRSRRFA